MAIKSASDASLCRFQHGCCIYNKRGIISTGFNKPRRLPYLSKFGYNKLLLHAESDAILKVDRRELKGASLLVIRLGKNKLCNSKPCPHCMSIITEVGIRNIYFSNVYGEIEELNY